MSRVNSVRHDCLDMIETERERQLALKAEGRFQYTPSDIELYEAEILAMIVEEVGEVARNVLARANLVTDGDQTIPALMKELSQVAALSLAWMERLMTELRNAEN